MHVDFAGQFIGKMFLIVVDSHSKWFEVEVMSTVTSESTIERLREMLFRYGVLQRMVRVKYTLIASYHPRSNGQAERFVQKFKQYFKEDGSKSINQSLPLSYLVTGQLRTARKVKHQLNCS